MSTIPRSAQDLFLEAFSELYESLRQELRAEGKKPNQLAVAARLGLPPSTVSEWVRGRHRGISLEVINRVAVSCNVPVARLFLGRHVLRDRTNPFTSESFGRTGQQSTKLPRKLKHGATQLSSTKTRILTADDLEDWRLGLEATIGVLNRMLRDLKRENGDDGDNGETRTGTR